MTGHKLKECPIGKSFSRFTISFSPEGIARLEREILDRVLKEVELSEGIWLLNVKVTVEIDGMTTDMLPRKSEVDTQK